MKIGLLPTNNYQPVSKTIQQKSVSFGEAEVGRDSWHRSGASIKEEYEAKKAEIIEKYKSRREAFLENVDENSIGQEKYNYWLNKLDKYEFIELDILKSEYGL